VDNERGAPTAAGLVANCLFLSKKSRWCFSFLEASFVDADLIVSTKNASERRKKGWLSESSQLIYSDTLDAGDAASIKQQSLSVVLVGFEKYN
jgi:hypothetical protein